MSRTELEKKCIELEFDNANIRAYAKALEVVAVKMVDVINELKSPSTGGASFFMSLQNSESVLKEYKSISKI